MGSFDTSGRGRARGRRGQIGAPRRSGARGAVGRWIRRPGYVQGTVRSMQSPVPASPGAKDPGLNWITPLKGAGTSGRVWISPPLARMFQPAYGGCGIDREFLGAPPSPLSPGAHGPRLARAERDSLSEASKPGSVSLGEAVTLSPGREPRATGQHGHRCPRQHPIVSATSISRLIRFSPGSLAPGVARTALRILRTVARIPGPGLGIPPHPPRRLPGRVAGGGQCPGVLADAPRHPG